EGKITLLEKKKKMEKMIKVLEEKAANRENKQKGADAKKVNLVQKDNKTIVNKAPPSESLITIRALDWDCVNFLDGFIVVRIGNRWFEKYSYKEAKKSLNYIKGLYKFRNAPNIVVEIVESRIHRILNLEVLEYYITFLS